MGIGFRHDYYNLHPSKICRAFYRLKKKKILLPEKGPTRVARDAAIVHPFFRDGLQKRQIFNISQCQQIYTNFCQFGLMTLISFTYTLRQTEHSARLVVWFKLEGWMSIIVLDKLPSRTFLEYLCNDSTVIWMLS